MRINTIRRARVDLLWKSTHIVSCGCLYDSAIYLYHIMFSIYYIASESNQVCLWLPYILNTTKSRLLIHSFPFCCGRRGSGLDVMTSARLCTGPVHSRADLDYRYYLCTNCTNTQCLLPALKGEGRFASWVILIGCAKTDRPITGNITGSFCIFLLANTAW